MERPSMLTFVEVADLAREILATLQSVFITLLAKIPNLLRTPI